MSDPKPEWQDSQTLVAELRARANARHSGEISETAKLCARAADELVATRKEFGRVLDLLDAANERAAVTDTAIAVWMMAHGFATGHGDTVKDMLDELATHVRERALARTLPLVTAAERYRDVVDVRHTLSVTVTRARDQLFNAAETLPREGVEP